MEDMRVHWHAEAEIDYYLQRANAKVKLVEIFEDDKTKYEGSLIQEDWSVRELKKKSPWISLQGNELLQCNWNNFKSTSNETTEIILGF